MSFLATFILSFFFSLVIIFFIVAKNKLELLLGTTNCPKPVCDNLDFMPDFKSNA